MKKKYITPKVSVYEMGAEKGFCNLMVTSGNTTSGFGTNPSSGTKGEFNSDIEFDDMSGTDMVRRNPWDSQW